MQIETLDELRAIFKTVEKRLKAKPWFKKGGWLVSLHVFPAQKPDGVTFHVSKKHWFNEEHQGIHIESYLDLDPERRKKSYLALHLCHYEKLPGTTLKRTALTQPVVDAIFDEVSKWPGYKFRAGKYGLQPFTKPLDGTSDNFVNELEVEVSRLCAKLGPKIDQQLNALCRRRT